MSLHSKLGASSMHRWAACPGSVRESEGVPSISSSYAQEGTKAHDIGFKRLSTGVWPSDIDEELQESLQIYVDELESVKLSKADKLLLEHRFDLSSIYPGLFGTADAVIYYAKNKKLKVIDYKHGQGLAVEVIEDGKPNLQLLYYALGALTSTKFLVNEIEMVVVQPRCPHSAGPVRRHTLPAIELLDFAADVIEAAKKTEDPNAPLIAGDHCRFCPAAFKCPEIHKKAVIQAQQDFSPAFSYDSEKLAKTLEWLTVLESWIKNVREFAYREAEHGRTPPGWKLVQKRATRKWKMSEEETASNLECLLPDQDCYWEKKLKSPAQVEKLLGKNGKKELEELVVAESSGYTLVPESDKRPSILLDATNTFTVITD